VNIYIAQNRKKKSSDALKVCVGAGAEEYDWLDRVF